MSNCSVTAMQRLILNRRVLYACLAISTLVLLYTISDPLDSSTVDSRLQITHPNDRLPQVPSPTTPNHEDSKNSSTQLPSFKPAKPAPYRPGLSTEGIALILKTGYEVYYDRLAPQLETFSSYRYGRTPDNTVIVSDFDHKINFTDWQIRDVVATYNETAQLKASEKYRIYHKQLEEIASRNQSSWGIDPPGTNNAGWRLDAMKFIPGYKLAADLFPDAEWTIGVDDDTYVLWDNLLAFLKMLDHTKPLYIGAPVMMPPSEIVFGHGGSIIITSQAAMKNRFIEHADGLEHWKEESLKWCCGDGVLAMAFSELGLNITGSYQPFFNGEHPENLRVNKDNFCKPVLGIHHTTRHSMHRLEEMIEARRKTKHEAGDVLTTIGWGEMLVMIAIDAHKSPESLELREEWDFLNMDDNNEKNIVAWNGEKSVAVCRATCEAKNSDCLSWVFLKEKEECYISRRAVPGRSVPGSISGLHMNGIRELQNSPACKEEHWREQVRNHQYN